MTRIPTPPTLTERRVLPHRRAAYNTHRWGFQAATLYAHKRGVPSRLFAIALTAQYHWQNPHVRGYFP